MKDGEFFNERWILRKFFNVLPTTTPPTSITILNILPSKKNKKNTNQPSPPKKKKNIQQKKNHPTKKRSPLLRHDRKAATKPPQKKKVPSPPTRSPSCNRTSTNAGKRWGRSKSHSATSWPKILRPRWEPAQQLQGRFRWHQSSQVLGVKIPVITIRLLWRLSRMSRGLRWGNYLLEIN